MYCMFSCAALEDIVRLALDRDLSKESPHHITPQADCIMVKVRHNNGRLVEFNFLIILL